MNQAIRHLDILIVLIITHHLDQQIPRVARDGLFRHMLDQIRHAHTQPLGCLFRGDKARPQHRHALRDHGDFELVLVFEIVEEFL